LVNRTTGATSDEIRSLGINGAVLPIFGTICLVGYVLYQ